MAVDERRSGGVTRRSFLRGSALAALGATVGSRLPWLAPGRARGPLVALRAAGSPGGGDVLVVVFARGGYDGLNLVVPYTEADYRRRRPTIAIPAPGAAAARKAVDLDGSFGLHPALAEAGWSDLYAAGLLAPIHAVHMDDATRSHFDAMTFMERGVPGDPTVRTGWLGRHLAATASDGGSPFRGVGIGTLLQTSLLGPEPAAVLQTISDFQLQARADEVARFGGSMRVLYEGEGWFDEQGRLALDAVDLLQQRVGGGTYRPANGATYPTSGFGRGLQQVAQLAKSDVGLEVACLDIGGWDTHANECDADDPTAGTLAGLLDDLGRGLAAFVTDLRDRFDPAAAGRPGITVVVMSEFGRRAAENGSRGTDHGHGNAMFLIGQGIVGGRVHVDPWPGLADSQLDPRGDLAGTIEYRDVLGEVLARRLRSTALETVFPGHEMRFRGVTRPLETPTPTPSPTASPTATPEPAPPGRAYLPWGGVGR